MKSKSLRNDKLHKAEYFVFIAVLFAIGTMLCGCTTNRISSVAPQPSWTPVGAGQVKFVRTFKDLDAPWTVEGMLSVYTLPTMSNSNEKRQTLIRNTAGEMGLNTVVALQSLEGDGHTGLSIGILANTGVRKTHEAQVGPKVIVLLPPTNIRIERSHAMELLDANLREQIQYFLGYTKGYYVYSHNPVGISSNDILQGTFNDGALAEPLGVTPDFALLCDIDGYDEKGTIVIYRATKLKVTFTLVDLKSRKVAWTSAGHGKLSKSFLIEGLEGLLTNTEKRSFIARSAVLNAIASMPAVVGFRGGAVSPMDRQ